MVQQHPWLTTIDYYEEGQRLAAPTINEWMNVLAWMGGGTVKSRSTTAQPGSPADGDAYIMPNGSLTGAVWSTLSEHDWALYHNGWITGSPRGGMTTFVEDETSHHRWGYHPDAAQWYPLDHWWTGTTGMFLGYQEDGSTKIFGKRVAVGALPDGTSDPNRITVAHSITGYDKTEFTEMYAHVHNTTTPNNSFPIPNLFIAGATSILFAMKMTNANIVIDLPVGQNFSGYDCQALIRYSTTTGNP